MIIAYGIIFALSLLMPPLYFLTIRKKQNEPWLLVLFICVCTVNLGYLLISFSKTVEFAIWANKITYLGQVFVPLCMFMIISKLCGFYFKKLFVYLLIGIAFVMFGIVLTTGWLDWYYVGVMLKYEDGASYLVKEYGVLHPANLIYVVAYFLAMLVVISISLKKNKQASQKFAGFMLAIVLGNIGMWVIEKIVEWNFEMLSVSYLMSIFAFYFVYILLQDYTLKKDLPQTKPSIIIMDTTAREEKINAIKSAIPACANLSARQMDVLEGIIDGKSRKEMAADLHLSENTIKMHTSSLYRILGVTGREALRSFFRE